MKKSVENSKKILEADDIISDSNGCYHISVTIDGTWQKRYGFSFLSGVIFLMSVLTGEIIDYVVRSKVCLECQDQCIDLYHLKYTLQTLATGSYLVSK